MCLRGGMCSRALSLWILYVAIPVAILSSQPFVKVSNSELKFLVKTFSSSNATSYKTVRLHNKTLYVGGRGTLFLQNPSDISTEASSPIRWEVLTQPRQVCKMLPQGNNDNCDNFVRTIQPYNGTHLLLCGTMALNPTNMFLDMQSGKLSTDDVVRTPLCSYNPSDNITSVLGSEGGAFSSIAATSRVLQSPMVIVKNFPNSGALRATQGDGKMINGNAEFVGSFVAYDEMNGRRMKKLYFVFRENAREPGRNKFGTRIAQVCANDIGGQWDSTAFTSFLKVPLLCQTDEKIPFPFDLVTDIALSNDGILYGIFTTQSSQFRTSALCAFKLSDIQNELHSENFWTKDMTTGMYEVVQSDLKEPGPPGMCSYPGMSGKADATSKDFPQEFVKFMSTSPLVAGAVNPTNFQSTHKRAGPLLADSKQRFSKIAVEAVTAIDGTRYNVLYVGREDGNVLKVLSSNEKSSLKTIQLAQYDISSEAISDMIVSSEYKQLYVQTTTQVLQMPTGNCEMYTKSCKFCDACRICVLSRDPMCAWNNATNICTDVRSQTEYTNLIQDVVNANIDVCEDLDTTRSNRNIPAFGSTAILGKSVKSSSILVRWFKGVDEEKQTITESDRHQITADGRLEISNFQQSDVGNYLSEYIIDNSIVAKEIVTFSDGKPTTSDSTTVSLGESPTDVPNKNLSSSVNSNSAPTVVVGTTPVDVVHEGHVSESMILGIFFGVVVILVLVIFFSCKRRRSSWCFNKNKSNLYQVEQQQKESILQGKSIHNSTHDVPDSGIHSIEANNSNNVILGNALRPCDEEYEKLLNKRNERFDQTPGSQERQVAAVLPRYRDDQDMDSIEFIDDDTQALPSGDASTKEPLKRTKSIPSQNLRINLGDDRVVKCNSIRRIKGRRTLLLEFDLPDDCVIEGDKFISDPSNLASPSFDKPDLTGQTEARSDDDEYKKFVTATSDYFAGNFSKSKKPSLDFVDTDSNSTLQASDTTIRPNESNNSSVTSTPRPNCPLESTSQILSSSPHQQRSQNNATLAQSQTTDNSENLELLSVSCDAPLRRNSSSNDVSPTFTSSSTSSDKFHTAPPSPVPLEVV